MNKQKKNKIHYLSFLVAIIACLASGILDGYSYLFKGNFGLIQTGNLINSVFYLLNGQFYTFITTFSNIICFCIAIFIAHYIEFKLKDKNLDIKNIEIIIILVLIAINMCIPNSFEASEGEVTLNRWIWVNILSNCIFAFVGAFIFRAFMEFNGNTYVSTMMTANMTRFVGASFNGTIKKEKGENLKALQYLLIIISFVIGIGVIYIFYRYYFLENVNDNSLFFFNYIPNLMLIAPLVLLTICLLLKRYIYRINNKEVNNESLK